MVVQVKSSSGITLVPEETRLLAQRRVFVEGEITPQSACAFARQIALLTAEDGETPIDVWINSPGGEVNAGMLMYDVVQGSPVPVRMFCLGRACSMAAVLFASGTAGRYLLEHAELMIHEPLISGGLGGSASSIHSVSERLMQTRGRINEILARHTGRSVAEVEQATSFDHYFSAQESIDFGLADEIVDFGYLFSTVRSGTAEDVKQTLG